MTPREVRGSRVPSTAAVTHIRALLQERPGANSADIARAAGVNRTLIWGITGDPPERTALLRASEAAILAVTPESLRIPSSRTIPGNAARALVADLMGRGWSRARIAEASGLSVTSIYDGQLVRVQLRTLTALSMGRAKLLAAETTHHRSGYAARTPTVRRVEALIAQQWPRKWLAQEVGVDLATLSPRAGASGIHSRTAIAVDALFHRYRNQLGPSAEARQTARRHGYAPWVLWPAGAIDDEAAVPDWSLMDDPAWRRAIEARYSRAATQPRVSDRTVR